MKALLKVISWASLFLYFVSEMPGQSVADVARQERARQQYLDSPKKDQGQKLSEADFKANILITDSHAQIEEWVLLPADSRPGAGRLRQVTAGRKLFVPIVVTDYAWPATERMNLTASIRLISPNGKTMLSTAKVAEAVAPDPLSPRVIVLNPVIDFSFDTTDLKGSYTIQVTVIDHIHLVSSSAEERVELVR
jgi:hypothetical protein